MVFSDAMTKAIQIRRTLGLALAVAALAAAPMIAAAQDKAKYRLRVASYSDQGLKIARSVEKRLDKAGFNAYLKRGSKGRILYVGRNMSKARAESVKRRVDAMLKVNSLIVAK